MKHIGILGVGAIGSLVTKYLLRNQSSNKCVFFNRSDRKSIAVTFQDQNDVIPIELSLFEDLKLDWLIVCLKEYQVQDALPNLKKLVSERTNVAIFQNGIDLSSRYLEFLNQEQVLETIIDCSVQTIGPNSYLQLRNPKIILPEKPMAHDFIELFGASDIQFSTRLDFVESQWVKLIESSAIGSIQAYVRKPCVIFQHLKYLTEFNELVKEGIKVGRSEGVNLDDNLGVALLEKLKTYPVSKGSSMLTDRLTGFQLELNAKIGVIVKIASKNGIKVPASQKLYELLLDINNS